MNVYESIMRGLQEAVDYEQGKGTARVVKMSIEPPPEITSAEIKEIRSNAGLTQKVFATLLGVSKKTVEAWESGTNSPAGPARRMIGIMRDDPDFIKRYNLIKV